MERWTSIFTQGGNLRDSFLDVQVCPTQIEENLGLLKDGLEVNVAVVLIDTWTWTRK